ncbi:MAG: ferredoxin [Klenkia sp.]|nr:ferredoxin [Klenkia sp.]
MSDRLRVDPIGCQGHGVCAELLPEAIALDEWGYPVLAPGGLPDGLRRPARRAVAACPARALHLDRDRGAADSGRSAGRQTPPGVLTGNAQGGLPQ